MYADRQLNYIFSDVLLRFNLFNCCVIFCAFLKMISEYYVPLSHHTNKYPE